MWQHYANAEESKSKLLGNVCWLRHKLCMLEKAVPYSQFNMALVTRLKRITWTNTEEAGAGCSLPSLALHLRQWLVLHQPEQAALQTSH